MSTQKCAKCLCSMDSRYLVQRKYVHVEDGPDGPVKSFLVCRSDECAGEWLEDYQEQKSSPQVHPPRRDNSKPLERIGGHAWRKNSGTTDACEACGLVRFWEDEYGPISPARATLALYGSIGKGTPSLKLSRCEAQS